MLSMVWSRRNPIPRRKRTARPAGEIISHREERAKMHAKVQLWLWRKRKANGIFGLSKVKRRALKKQLRSKPLHCFGKRRVKNTHISSGPSDFKNCKTSYDGHKRSEATQPAICRVENVRQSVSTDSDFRADHDNIIMSASSLSLTPQHNVDTGANGDCLDIELDLSSRVVDFAGNNEEGTSVTIECPRQRMLKHVQEYLCDFHLKYGSFIPLDKHDIFEHLKQKLKKISQQCEIMILEMIIEEISKTVSIPHFEIKYKKHRLTMDDLLTLASDNWLNDQVINMYGELIMESADYQVHFLNSFFHRQLFIKGYEGVRRWTKQVDLFSKRLLLVPVHLEVHWCLVTADFVNKTVCLYDSQAIGLQKVARSILKYLLKEAKEKQKPSFETGWTVCLKEEIPIQTSENDCGVFVLEYSRCLALTEPLQFSQKDIPKIRKRLYKELCERELHKKN